MRARCKVMEDGALRRKSIELFYEFEWRSLVQAVELLSKTVTYYFAILAALVGYLFTVDLSPADQKLISRVIFIVSGLFSVLAAAMVYGILYGIADLRATLMSYSPGFFHQVGMPRYFRRGQVVGLLAAIASLAILATICTALALKFFT